MGTSLKLMPLFIIFLAVIFRLLPHAPNFTPITAIALFGGVYLHKKYAFILPIFAMLISDYFIGFDPSSMGYVYGSFLISGLIGIWIRERKDVKKIFGGTLLASLIFYLVTNFGVWAQPNSWYPKSIDGLMSSYIAGIPFFKNTLLGDLFYTGVLFGIYEFAYLTARRVIPNRIFSIIF